MNRDFSVCFGYYYYYQYNSTLRDRCTIAGYNNRVQKPLTKDQKIYYYSKYPLGVRISRTTYRTYIRQDQADSIVPKITAETGGLAVFFADDLGPDTDKEVY